MGAIARRLHPDRVKRTLGAASCVRRPVRFVANELRRASRPVERGYSLRSSGRVARVRQPLLDMWVLEEVFRLREYEPPAEVMAVMRALESPVRILDLGAHVGLFGLFVEQLLPGARITSFEPDPGNAAVLRRCIDANALGDRWRLVEACAATSEGAVDFVSSHHLSRAGADAEASLDELHTGLGAAFHFLAGTPLTRREHQRVEALDVFPWLEEADLLKMDIEGAEWEILADPRFSDIRVPALVLEYHPAYGPHERAEDAVRDALGAAGYRIGLVRERTDGGVVWAWREPGQATAPGKPG